MKKFSRIAIAMTAVAIGSVIWSQQAKEQPSTVEERLAKLEERLVSTERAVRVLADPPTRLPEGALEARLMRLEDRLTRLETSSQRTAPGAPGPNFDRVLEARIRALERQVARLSQ
jgi:hypothetical protein